MKSIVVDTNAFLRFFLNDISEQAESVEKLLQRGKNGEVKLIVPQVVIFEIHFALEKLYKIPKEEIIETLKSLISMDYLQIQDKDIFGKALERYSKYNLSLPDCFLRSAAEKENAELFTFDKKLEKLK
jgi:predicted nucleic-acid-binding protein